MFSRPVISFSRHLAKIRATPKANFSPHINPPANTPAILPASKDNDKYLENDDKYLFRGVATGAVIGTGVSLFKGMEMGVDIAKYYGILYAPAGAITGFMLHSIVVGLPAMMALGAVGALMDKKIKGPKLDNTEAAVETEERSTRSRKPY